MEKHFIIVVREHRVWGAILSPCLAESVKDKTFFLIKTFLTNEAVESGVFPFTAEQVSIIRILDAYNDLNLMRLFDKKSDNLHSFLSNVDRERVEKLIRPFIESKMKQVIELLFEHKQPSALYYKKDDLLTLHASDQIVLREDRAKAVFNFERVEHGIRYFLSAKVAGTVLKLLNRRGVCLVNDPCYAIIDNDLLRFQDIDFKKLLPFFSKGFVQIPKSSEKMYFESFVFKAIQRFDVNAEGFRVKEVLVEPKVTVSVIADIYNRVLFEVWFMYPNAKFRFGETKLCAVTLEVANGEYGFVKVCRLGEFEREVTRKLADLSLFEVANGLFGVKHSDLKDSHAAILWLNENRDKLRALDIEVDSNLMGKTYFSEGMSINLQLEERNDWFDVFGSVTFGTESVPFVKLRKHIVNGVREFVLPSGLVAVLPEEWFAEYQEMMLMGNEHKGRLKLRKFHFNTISKTVQGVNTEVFDRLKKMSHAQICVENPPEGLLATLRSYQQLGFSWLLHLDKCGFGGCLADDMGLGKTLQTLAVLQYSISKRNLGDDAEQSRTVVAPKVVTAPKPRVQLDLFGNPVPGYVPPPRQGGQESEEVKVELKVRRAASLIVMPVSLVDNWGSEIAKFTPGLSVYKYLGTSRVKSLINFDGYDIILSSYGIVRNDIDFLEGYDFHYLVLDESQYMKNPNSKVYHAVNKLSAQKKMVLTGTPIENSLIDLWTQLNFLNKGMLGNLSFFKNEFITPIERNKDPNKQIRLKKLIEPFILRRTKQEVAQDLPPITEQIMYCDMSDEQASYYEEEKSVVRNSIMESIELGGVEKSSILVLRSLTRLRQIANHPRLVDPDFEFDSGKFELVISYLNNLVAGRNKVLIFSSFVKHLNLFEKYFNENGLKYVKLVGDTKDRHAQVNQFQGDEETRLFLISLKAGGVGLNLTAADYVFLLDPWWNPAAENQAIGRAHRIGQNKKVFVYRFISKASIEEKIIQLQERKTSLAEIFVSSSNPFKSLSRESIEELFT